MKLQDKLLYVLCLFLQVTDNELQAITKQDPDVQPHMVEIENDGNVATVYVVDGIQEREELVGESEVCNTHFHWLILSLELPINQ